VTYLPSNRISPSQSPASSVSLWSVAKCSRSHGKLHEAESKARVHLTRDHLSELNTGVHWIAVTTSWVTSRLEAEDRQSAFVTDRLSSFLSSTAPRPDPVSSKMHHISCVAPHPLASIEPERFTYLNYQFHVAYGKGSNSGTSCTYLRTCVQTTKCTRIHHEATFKTQPCLDASLSRAKRDAVWERTLPAE
jgi:hypothetical protein